MCGQIIARVALRTLLGFPACRNEELVKATQHFANNLFTAAAIIDCMHPLLRPILAPLLAIPTQRYRTQYRKIVVPLIEERIRLWQEHEKTGEGELPVRNIFLATFETVPTDTDGIRATLRTTQWLVPRAAQHGPCKNNPDSEKRFYDRTPTSEVPTLIPL